MRAKTVMAVQDLVMQTTNEIKLQKELVVKSKLQKSRGRTKAAYKAAAEQLTPAEQEHAAFDLESLPRRNRRCTEVKASWRREAALISSRMGRLYRLCWRRTRQFWILKGQSE